MSLLDSFLIRAALAGIGVAVAAAPLGCFVLWRRMAYFGDATAHGSILGVALALAFDLPVFWGALAVALVMALVVSSLSGRNWGMDAVLGVMSHSALAIGLVAVSFTSGMRVDLLGILIGDILSVSRGDLLTIWAGAGLVLALLWWHWSALLLSTLNPDLAIASGINPRREQYVLTLALALVVAVAIKVVGVLLIAAMLIIPAAAARPLSSTPERMAIFGVGIGAASALAGLAVSFHLDTPAGPSIVCCAAVFFAISALVRQFRAAS